MAGMWSQGHSDSSSSIQHKHKQVTPLLCVILISYCERREAKKQ